MAFYGKNVGIVPLTDAAGITQPFSKTHNGVDIGWNKAHNCAVMAWQDGTVVGTGYYSDTGYYVALEHVYGNTKRFTCYIHMTSSIKVSKGQAVKLGQTIGYRGNTGRSTGEHLHMYLTTEISKNITWNFTNMKKYVTNPVPYLYYSKQFNTIYISATSWTKPLPDPVPDIVQPVPRDITKDQLICHEDDLRVRAGAGISQAVLGHLEKDKYYNYFDAREADNYLWLKLADRQWCAKIDSVDLLPKMVPVEPVERNEKVDQLTCSIGNLRIRTAPSLKAEQIGFLQKDKFYNDLGHTDADGYTWIKLAENQYCAKVEEVTLLPAVVYYTVKVGDTLQSIAKQYDLTLDRLVEMNPQLIKVGDKLKVK